eukprot:CAMPEP_0181085684 /NCGR_PEP_ID=MMETSP1071-20121207/5356_1 /TAXON_ID=35127 /ORGANISM="Thalassiosira sp., Strain NH16" /LENGTH=731 /DNA_ID=CAMNT_0023167493 /DNA_START=206 /DNA_END=2398 /DNA_ORIENTATION=+
MASSSFSCSPVSRALSLKITGNEHLASGNFALAIDTYTEALKLLPSSNKTKIAFQKPSLRAILLSNRSHAHLLLKQPSKALNDADACIETSPKWSKAHLRRANALRKSGTKNQRRDALDAYEDAIAAAELEEDAASVSQLQSSRKNLSRELRETGSSRLSKEIAELGCLLAIPEGAKIERARCHGVILEPASYDGVDDRTNTPIHAECPGDDCWPIFSPVLCHKNGEKLSHMPLCYYVIGPCILTKACVREIDDIFKPNERNACNWPDGKSTRTCPFCAIASTPDKNETYSMVVHLLIGKSAGNLGMKLMMQLVCERCTRRRMLNKVVGESGSKIDPLHRLQKLTDSSHAIKTSVLWNRASNMGLLSSITIHAQKSIHDIMLNEGVSPYAVNNTGSISKAIESSAKCDFFEKWLSRLDERETYTAFEGEDMLSQRSTVDRFCDETNGNDLSTSSEMGVQPFHIRQVATIKKHQKALTTFWKTHGADFRLFWAGWNTTERNSFVYDAANSFFQSRLDHYNRRHTQHFHVEDPRPLVNKPFGKVPKKACSFLPELTGSVFGKEKYDLLELFRNRLSKTETWVAEDVALIDELRKHNRLPKLFYNEQDGSYLCDYMGLKDSNAGPFVVLVGSREAEYNSSGEVLRFDSDQIMKMRDYHNLRDPFFENTTVYSAKAPGQARNKLQSLIDSGVATDAVCYIYATMRQVLLLEYLQSLALSFCQTIGKDDPDDLDKW